MTNQALPRISIITPSYNQGVFLEDTIRSVLGQGYPHLEYIVMDGGSTDNSVDIIKKYEAQLTHWESARDNGQAHAINKGFAKATGDVVAWLNSDDMYLPGTLDFIGRYYQEHATDRASIVFGNCVHVNDKELQARGSNVRQMHETRNIELLDYIIQPSSFWTMNTLDAVGTLHEQYTYGFDWEWFIRAKRAGAVFHPVDRFLSIYRIHESHKTGTGGEERLREIADLYTTFHPQKIADVFLQWKLDRKVDVTRRLLSVSKLDTIIDPSRLLYSLYFRTKVSWQEFDDIRRM